ncbi:MAG: hypothetical protein JWN85_3252 [Gammaproteobacteria bacterium]|nr:hypothetical protein [Gammaproteobacteria bacterium]
MTASSRRALQGAGREVAAEDGRGRSAAYHGVAAQGKGVAGKAWRAAAWYHARPSQ